MKKRFIVLLDNCSAEEEEALRLHFESVPGWWHWLPNVWLLDDPAGTLSAAQVRSDIRKVLPTKNQLVLEISGNGDTWAGFGPSTKEKNMFAWIKANWHK